MLFMRTRLSNSHDESELNDICYAIIKREKWNNAKLLKKKIPESMTANELTEDSDSSINLYQFSNLSLLIIT